MVDGIGGLECELHARIAANRVYQPLAKKLMGCQVLELQNESAAFSLPGVVSSPVWV